MAPSSILILSASTQAARFVLLAFFSMALCLPALAGTEVLKDGVLHIQNSEVPTAGTDQIHLQELWRVGGIDDEEVLLGVVGNLIEDGDGNIYILDSQLSAIHVFSPAGEFLRTIGREGEGPGEFQNAIDLYLGPGNLIGVVQVYPGKIVQLTLDGAPSGEFPLPLTEGGGFQLIRSARATENSVVIVGAQSEGEGDAEGQRTYLKAFDSEGREIVHYHDEVHPMRYGRMKYTERGYNTFAGRWALSGDGRVAAALDFDAYQIHLWNADGTLDRVIERPGYVVVERSKQAKKRFQKFYDGSTSWNPESTFAIAQNYLTVNRIHFREDGSMWVLASSGMYQNQDGVFATFDVYSPEGDYVRQVEIRGEHDPAEDGMFFVGNQLYVVTELFSARMASIGGDIESEEDSEEAEPISVIAYSIVSSD